MLDTLRTYILLGSLILFLASCSGNTPEPPPNLSFHESLQWSMDQHNLPSLSIVMVKNDQIVSSVTFGKANQEQPLLANTHTPYIIGSVTKVITATAIMQLAEQGKLDIDADISSYLPFNLRNPNHPNNIITTRMLLLHRSSLSRDGESRSFSMWQHFSTEDVPTLGNWLEDYLLPGGSNYHPDTWTEKQPDSQQLYSNIGATLLGYVVEYVSGQDFRDYCLENIFDPLGMYNTAFRKSNLANEPATPYDDGGRPMGHFSLRPYPAGFLYSSAHDLSIFLRAFINDGVHDGVRILKTETVTQMLSRQSGDLGLIWWHHAGWVGHNGGYQGVAAFMDFDQDTGLGAVILTNTHSEQVNQSNGSVYKAVHEEARTHL